MNQVSDFTLIRSSRKSLSIEITPHAQVIVRAPLHTSYDYIKKFVNEKKDWVEKHLKNKQKHYTKHYVQGEEFLYLGNVYKLHIGNYKNIHIKDSLNFPDFLLFRIKKEISGWYIKQAKEIITERTKYYSKIIKIDYKNISFSDTKSKWGSCSHQNDLQFNWRLIMAPYLVIDYVVIHELVHTIHKNHSGQFWRKVEVYKPAYRQHRKWLHTNSHRLTL